MLALASVRWNFKSASPSQSGKLSAGPDRCCHRSETHEEDKTCHADWTHSEAARRTDENQANLLSVVVGLKDVADESAVTAPACWLQNETKQPLVVLMRRTLKHSGEGELQKERGGGQGEGGDDKSLENCQRLKPEQRSRDHLTLSRVTCVWGSMSLKRKKYKHRYQRVAKNYKSRNSFSFLPFQFLCFNLWQWYVVSDPLNNDGPALLCVTKYSSHNDNLTQNTQTHTHTLCGSYLRQSQVTSRCDSVILKMLWMALAARICLMVSEMTSADSAVFTSMEPRKRTMKSWWRIESGQHEKHSPGFMLAIIPSLNTPRTLD